jgi:exodeoxyribonuclease VII large subunit
LAFEVTVVPTTVQGDSAPPAIVEAIKTLDSRGLDVICVIRGGGSKADLACFDDEFVARAIGGAVTPIWTGIGHTGDTSVADMAANYFAITPTELGVHLVQRATEAYVRHVTDPAARLLNATHEVLDDATQRVQSARREILSTARNRLTSEQRALRHHAATMVRAARSVLTSSHDQLGATRQLFAAYDPQRRLDQGWSIVTTSDGSVVKSIDQVAVGLGLNVRVSDGTIETTVTQKKGTKHG